MLKSVKWADPLWRSSSSWLRRLNKCFLGVLQFLTHFSLEYLLEAWDFPQSQSNCTNTHRTSQLLRNLPLLNLHLSNNQEHQLRGERLFLSAIFFALLGQDPVGSPWINCNRMGRETSCTNPHTSDSGGCFLSWPSLHLSHFCGYCTIFLGLFHSQVGCMDPTYNFSSKVEPPSAKMLQRAVPGAFLLLPSCLVPCTGLSSPSDSRDFSALLVKDWDVPSCSMAGHKAYSTKLVFSLVSSRASSGEARWFECKVGEQ